MEATQRPDESFETFLTEALSQEQRERLEEQIRQRVFHPQVQEETRGALETAIQEAKTLRQWVVVAGSASVGGGLAAMGWSLLDGSPDVILSGTAMAVIGGILLLFGVRTLPAATTAFEGYRKFIDEVREAVTAAAESSVDGPARENEPWDKKTADG